MSRRIKTTKHIDVHTRFKTICERREPEWLQQFIPYDKRRNIVMCEMKKDGYSYENLSTIFNISVRHVRNILKAGIKM